MTCQVASQADTMGKSIKTITVTVLMGALWNVVTAQGIYLTQTLKTYRRTLIDYFRIYLFIIMFIFSVISYSLH